MANANDELGMFIVLEGIDGAGTTTQTARLVERLRADGVHARGTREPSDGPVGSLVRQVLTGRVVTPGGRAPAWAAMAPLAHAQLTVRYQVFSDIVQAFVNGLPFEDFAAEMGFRYYGAAYEPADDDPLMKEFDEDPKT